MKDLARCVALLDECREHVDHMRGSLKYFGHQLRPYQKDTTRKSIVLTKTLELLLHDEYLIHMDPNSDFTIRPLREKSDEDETI